jgi:hypothetical protein
MLPSSINWRILEAILSSIKSGMLPPCGIRPLPPNAGYTDWKRRGNENPDVSFIGSAVAYVHPKNLIVIESFAM